MKINLLNLFICPELFFIEQQKKNLQKFCEENNYQFLKQTVEKDNHEKILNFLKQELYTNSFFFIKKFIFIQNISVLFKNKNIDLVFFNNYWDKPRNDIIIYLVETKENDFPPNINQKIKNFFYI
ncbi:DNA polymerase III subunit delta, partial [Candidatus Phytoplasma phoenicium]